MSCLSDLSLSRASMQAVRRFLTTTSPNTHSAKYMGGAPGLMRTCYAIHHVYCRWLAHAMCLEGEEWGRILLIKRTNSSHACCCFIIQLYFSDLSGFLSPDNAICDHDKHTESDGPPVRSPLLII